MTRSILNLAGGALTIALGSLTAAQEPAVVAPPAVRLADGAGGDVLYTVASEAAPDADEPQSEYWLGLSIGTLPEVARQQLGVEEGLTVEDVAPDSPAAKADFKKHDILVKAGDKPLKEPADLVKAVNDSQGKAMRVVIVRRGKEMTVDATPTKRPENEAHSQGGALAFRGGSPEIREEIKRLEEVLQTLKNKAGDGNFNFFFARPGVVRNRVDVMKAGELPKDLSVQINKEGNQPAKIHVKQGDKEWDVTEDKLGDLPEEVRAHVQRYLGQPMAIHFPGPGGAGARTIRVLPDGKVEGEMRITPHPPVAPMAARPPHGPIPPAAGARPMPPMPPAGAHVYSYRNEQRSEGTDAKLDTIMKKLDELRKDVDDMRAKSGDNRNK